MAINVFNFKRILVLICEDKHKQADLSPIPTLGGKLPFYPFKLVKTAKAVVTVIKVSMQRKKANPDPVTPITP